MPGKKFNTLANSPRLNHETNGSGHEMLLSWEKESPG